MEVAQIIQIIRSVLKPIEKSAIFRNPLAFCCIFLYNYNYHLVMTNIAMERSTIFKFGKPSISIRAIYTMAMLVITRG